ncbi:N(4)-(Beta-N-acetylglucosaminyl)-L-asparaginase [Fasciola gigantica]|uniref:N(4)-(Beta-N-acetylglucosaminyl)-L-asparaginase n=1 Tax=Fasciola gigantica TaxID=46835 RepID=A0A504YS82_FASGI|nr:N(4)-(Beta-N-acetylglucosaminyl)-L-asparaginase [Fasciola gigantica]
MSLQLLVFVLLAQFDWGISSPQNAKPVTVISTWPFTKATDAAWEVLSQSIYINGEQITSTAVNAVVAGCSQAEEDRTITSVGYGCSPDEEGHTTLDAMVIDGDTMNVGAVAAMPYIRQAAQVAREVLCTTKHSLIVGIKATEFAMSRGYQKQSLDTPESIELWNKWKAANCQPNYREPSTWIPDPQTQCGPYGPKWTDVQQNYELIYPPPSHFNSGYYYHVAQYQTGDRPEGTVDEDHHDTIGMIAIDAYGSMAVGLSTSGAIHKIPGRVGDTPIPGSGGYVDSEVGGAVGTGDGDVLMRFSLSFQAVSYMRNGISPEDACAMSLKSVKQTEKWSGALVALNATGHYGAACVGFGKFQFALRSENTGNSSIVLTVDCK